MKKFYFILIIAILIIGCKKQANITEINYKIIEYFDEFSNTKLVETNSKISVVFPDHPLVFNYKKIITKKNITYLLTVQYLTYNPLKLSKEKGILIKLDDKIYSLKKSVFENKTSVFDKYGNKSNYFTQLWRYEISENFIIKMNLAKNIRVKLLGEKNHLTAKFEKKDYDILKQFYRKTIFDNKETVQYRKQIKKMEIDLKNYLIEKVNSFF